MDDIDKIKQKLDIVDIIGQHLQLKKAGRNFKTNCPFHSEKTPSFVVSPERQIWHCFGCQKGGDIFSFLTDYENITFSEALKDLAARAGVKLTVSPARSQKEKKQETIHSLNHLSSQFYNYLLLSHPAGKIALDYLIKQRKMTIPLIKTFMLGYAPGNDALTKYLIGKKKYQEQDLIEAGLAYKRGIQPTDFFKDRIIFPIFDIRGNVIAFSGRELPGKTTGGGKYVNTRETAVYIKGNSLYGLDVARDAIKKEGKVIIVEGEFDVITAHREGILNIVAVKGTALTENQITLLKRLAPRFAFCFDSDPAGTEAQRRSIQLIEKSEIAATVIKPSQGKDPDELLNENPALFKKAVKNDVNVYDFIIDSAALDFDKNTGEGKKNILEKTLPYITSIENEVIKEHYLKRLATLLETSFDSVLKQAEKIKSQKKEASVIPASQLPKEEIKEAYLLSLILQSDNPKTKLAFARSILQGIPLSTPSFEKVLEYLEKFQQKTPQFSAQSFAQFLPQELHALSDTAYLAPLPEFEDSDHYQKEIEKTATQVRVEAIRKKIGKLAESIKTSEQEKNEDKIKTYQEEFTKLSKLLTTS